MLKPTASAADPGIWSGHPWPAVEIPRQFGALWDHFRALWVHIEVTLAQVGASLTLSQPEADFKLAQDRSKVAKVEPKMASNVYLGALWGHFGITLASLWITLGTLEGQFGDTGGCLGGNFTHFWCIFGSFWTDKGHFNITLTMRGSFLGNTHFSNWF